MTGSPGTSRSERLFLSASNTPLVEEVGRTSRSESEIQCRQTAKIKGPQNYPRSFFVPKIWQEREDSNPRPLVLETSALARLSYAPALYGVLGRQPKWLTVQTMVVRPVFNGTPGGSRTPDARLRTPPLYPLSYRGNMVEIEGLEPSASALRTPRSPN